ncbi:uncharacterized protein V1513DRAFT_375426 [Lipomyces chichibuensis]|uniref:uncharacterized protein n=1 Tax=Lipomyces chichibuensis TaxID=1546026 RepID=UPI0033433616
MALPTIGWTISQWREAQIASTSEEAVKRVLDLVSSFDKSDPAWITIATPEQITAQFEDLTKSGKVSKDLPLFGVPFAPKDNIDAATFPTTAACPAYLYHPDRDATIVAILKAAGAIVVGKTNLDQFATGLVGARSPYGKTPSAFSDKHVSGGSSAGSGNVVGRGIVPFSLGTDTAGSGRVPAMLNNVIGLKPTRGAFSATGVVPACRTLDCVSIFSMTVPDAQLVFSIAAKYDIEDAYSRHLPSNLLTSFGPKPRFAVPDKPIFYEESKNPVLYAHALEKFADLGIEIVPQDFSLLYKLAACLYEGPWVGERYTVIADLIKTNPDAIDPVVLGIVKQAEKFTAADLFNYEYLRKDLERAIQVQFAGIDGFIVPTAPLNPTFEELAAEPVVVNSRQGTYTNFVNFADMSALAIPAGFRDDGLPFGVTLISGTFNDYALLELAERFLAKSPRLLGNTQIYTKPGVEDKLIPSIPKATKASGTMQLAVVGAHLSGLPLHYQLTELNAKLAFKTTTSADYRLYHLANTTPPKPGLRRIIPGHPELIGENIELEVYDIPSANFGAFIAQVPPPLAIGSVELENGHWVKGFVCEENGFDGAKDVTKFGGWRAYVQHMKERAPKKPFDTVLVANRGEIAVRIIRTLKKLGIKAIAVFAEPDRFSPHVLNADDAVSLEGESAAETYLRIDKIIAAAKQTDAQAIIPGYGFLSENADFAETCEKEGIVFVGPSAESIRLLGLKHSAREIATKANVPLVPGSGLLETVAEALAVGEDLGYPVMLKSTAGGGGIGLQRCENAEYLKKAFDSVRRLGQSYFNDSGVFLERYVENARHVEVQIFGDGNGNALALGERDCSLQRRNQKIIEETPAPNLPSETRAKMVAAAESLARTMKYKCAGTVEFIYDAGRDEFYFLEVNTRLQVEHPVTEMVTGLDLVEWMLLIAANTPPCFDPAKLTLTGASVEARLYAENPVKDFLPSPGQLIEVSFPEFARVDTWVAKGTEITASFDPLLAKIIVHGKDRADALAKLVDALESTVVSGIVTNLDYLRSIAASELFAAGAVSTRLLDSWKYNAKAVELLAPGSYTTVQDYPGRIKLWHIGVPPSGPMDDYAFRLANTIVGNDSKAPAIECTLVGPSIKFHCDAVISITGGGASPTVDDEPVPMWEPIAVSQGQTLVVGKITSGSRSYIGIRGGLDVPEYLGSRSTFALGNMGGYNGRVLKFGDVLYLGQPELKSCSIPAPIAAPKAAEKTLIPEYPKIWTIGVLSGPHGAPDFFTQKAIDEFLAAEWKVHYNSNRFGVRLIGPKPEWSRPDGGEAGLHPSNIHDCVYALGAINFTGDEPVILTCDGPSLGGFVCPVTVAEAEMWKVGQLKPGDLIKFVMLTFDEAIMLKRAQDLAVSTGSGTVIQKPNETPLENPILYESAETTTIPKVVYRQAGDRFILVEYGENILDIRLSYRVYQLSQLVKDRNTAGIVEMSPGVRSVLIQYNGLEVPQSQLIKELLSYESELVLSDNWQVPSRIVRLPLAFEDSATLAAVDRYRETIRNAAPWLPNNVDFLTEVNHLDDRDIVREILYDAKFLVLGLGDVFLGAPCAVPLDPRHRLLGTKYNPSRTFTPNGTVGIGGMYMCIYTMESPGGYQLVGRTIPIWDKLTLGQQDRPWLLDIYDRVEYYPVTEEELAQITAEVNHGRFKIDIEEGIFDYGEYSKWLNEHGEELNEYARKQREGTEEIAKLIQVSNAELQAAEADRGDAEDTAISENAVPVYGEVAGRFWKDLVKVGDVVKKGDGIIVVEAMKTEMVVNAPSAGKVIKIVHRSGDFVEAGDVVAYLEE